MQTIFFRRKIGPNIQYKGERDTIELIKCHHDTYIFVDEKRFTYLFKRYAAHLRDIDIISETLDAIPTQYYLESNNYVPERVQNRIDLSTSWMIESGMHSFYRTFSDYLMEIISKIFRGQQIEEDDAALTMEQLGRPLKLVLFLFGLAFIVFICEILTHYFYIVLMNHLRYNIRLFLDNIVQI